MIVIDEAEHTDIPQLCELAGILFSQEQEFLPDEKKQTDAFRQLIANHQRGRVFVLRKGAAILGMVNVQLLVSTACGGDVLLLEDLVVRPACRNRGYGAALLEHVIDFARRSGYGRITLLTDKMNTDARRFYARHGFSPSDMVPYRMLF